MAEKVALHRKRRRIARCDERNAAFDREWTTGARREAGSPRRSHPRPDRSRDGSRCRVPPAAANQIGWVVVSAEGCKTFSVLVQAARRRACQHAGGFAASMSLPRLPRFGQCAARARRSGTTLSGAIMRSLDDQVEIMARERTWVGFGRQIGAAQRHCRLAVGIHDDHVRKQRPCRARSALRCRNGTSACPSRRARSARRPNSRRR